MAAGEFIEILSPSALKDLNTLNAELVKTVESVTQVNKLMGTASTPGASSKAIADLNKMYQDQTVIVQNLQKELQKLQQVKTTGNARTSEEIVNQRILAKNADDVAKANSKLVGSYQKLSLAYEKQKKLALDLGATYGMQSQQFTDASAKANLMAKELKTLDNAVGVNNRNVGNYANSFAKGLDMVFSKIRLIAYILPGLGIAGIFGLALDPLFNFLKGLNFVQQALGLETAATKAAKKAIEEKTKAEAAQNQEIASTISSEQNRARILLENVKNENITMAQRVKNFDELKTKYGTYLGDLTLEKALAGDTAEAEYRLNDALMKRGMALAVQSLLQKNAEKQVQTELEYGLAVNKNINATELYDTKQQSTAKTSKQLRMLRDDEVEGLDTYSKTLNTTTASVGKHNKAVVSGYVTSDQARKKALAPQKEEEQMLLKLYKAYAPYLDALTKETKSQKERVDLVFSSIKSWYELQKAIIAAKIAEDKPIANDVVLGYETRIAAQKRLVESTLKLIDLQKREQDALDIEGRIKDLDRNKVAFKNAQITEARYLTNIAEINKTYQNNKNLSAQKANNEINQLLEDDKNFFLKMEADKWSKYKDNLAKRKSAEEQYANTLKGHYQNIANDETKVLDIRQESFRQYKNLELAELNLKRIQEEAAVDRSEANTEQNAQLEAIANKYKVLVSEVEKIKTPLEKAAQATDDWLSTFKSNFLSNSGMNSLNIFFDDLNHTGMSTFETLMKGAELTGKQFEVAFNAAAEVAQEAFNLMNQQSDKRFENEKKNLEAQKDIALKFAGDSAAAKDKINKEYDEKVRALEIKRAKEKQKQAIYNVAIDTAQAIVATFAELGWPAGIFGAAVVAALGAAQISLISSQQIPGYYTGTDNAPGGLAWTDERGAEIHTDKHGNIKDFGSDGGARMKYLAPGDKIFNAYETKKILSQGDFDTQLMNILTSRDISTPIVVNNGITPSQMNEIMKEHLGSQSKQNINFDRNGFSRYVVKSGNITRDASSRGSGKGKNV